MNEKLCPYCNRILPHSMFSKLKRSPTGLNYECRECNTARVVKRKVALKWRMIEYLGGACKHCLLVSDIPNLYDIHHIDPATKTIAPTELRTATWARQKAELDKCILLCRNCHRQERLLLLTSNYGILKYRAVELFGDYCFDCSHSFPLEVYDFHHLDPTKKDRNLSTMFKSCYSALLSEKMLEELTKCVMLCANCHATRHWSPKCENRLTAIA